MLSRTRSIIGVRAIFLPWEAVNYLPKTFLLVAQSFTKQSKRNEGRCNNIGRTGIWKWLDTVFQGQYLPSLSINYVAINKHLEKLPPQLYEIKMKICCDQGCNDIGVVTATKWSHYLLYLQQYFSVGTVLLKSITGAFSSNSRLDVREVKTESVRALSGYFGIKFLSLEIQ